MSADWGVFVAAIVCMGVIGLGNLEMMILTSVILGASWGLGAFFGIDGAIMRFFASGIMVVSAISIILFTIMAIGWLLFVGTFSGVGKLADDIRAGFNAICFWRR
jgi:hypothetical protein